MDNQPAPSEVHDVSLRLFMREDSRHQGMPMHEWLLEEARRHGLSGGSAFRAVAGFGRHGVMHEETFFELAGKLPLMTEFIVSEADAESFVGRLGDAGIALPYTLTRIRQGVTGGSPGDT